VCPGRWGVWEAAELQQILLAHLAQCFLTVLCSCQASLWQTMKVASGSCQEGCRWVHPWGEKEAAEGGVTLRLPFQALLLCEGHDSPLTQSPSYGHLIALVTIDNWSLFY
jgi:hypothetical protein